MSEVDPATKRRGGSYRWASLVRLTIDDPVNDFDEGQEMIIAGRCEDGVAHTVFNHDTGDFLQIECEVVKRYHAESWMTRDEIIGWASEQARGDIWPEVTNDE